MNRAMRRKQNANTVLEDYVKNPEKYEPLVHLLENKILHRYDLLWLFVLRDKFGFGKVRIARLGSHIEELSDAIAKKYLTFEDIENQLKEEGVIDGV